MERRPNQSERHGQRVEDAIELIRPLFDRPVNNAVLFEAAAMLTANLLPYDEDPSMSYKIRRAAARHLVELAMNDESAQTLLFVALEALTALADYWDLATIRDEIKEHSKGCECEYCIESASRCDCKDCQKKRSRFEEKARRAESLVS